MSIDRIARCGAMALLLAALPNKADGQGVVTVAQQLASARGAALAGDYDGAEAIFARLALSETGPARIDAAFGVAFVHQRRLAAGDTSGRGLSLDRVLAEYRAVESGGSASVKHAAATNRALMLTEYGDAPRAAEAYDDAAVAARDAERITARLRSAEAWMDVGNVPRAELWYREVLASEPANPVARAGLCAVMVRRGARDSLLAVTQRWRNDTSIATAITEALVAFLTSGDAAGDRIERSYIVELARNLTVRRITSETFVAQLVPPLNEARRRRPRLELAILSMFEAFTPFGAAGYRVGASTGAWWGEQEGESGTAIAWSGMLRMIGDQFRLMPDRESWARRYYEVALGFDGQSAVARISPDADPTALRQLGLIYARQRDITSTTRLADAADRFANSPRAAASTDSAKSLRALRDYHVAMGAFLTRERELAPAVADQADRHTIRMIQIGDRIGQSGAVRPRDPPNLLTDLAVSQQARNRSDSARAVTGRLEASLRDLKVENAGSEAVRRVRDKETTTRPRPNAVRPDLAATLAPSIATTAASSSASPSAATRASSPTATSPPSRGAAAAGATGGLAGARSRPSATAPATTPAAATAVSVVPESQTERARLIALAVADDSMGRAFTGRRDSVARVIMRESSRVSAEAQGREWNRTLDAATEQLNASLRRVPITTLDALLEDVDRAIANGARSLTEQQRGGMAELTARFVRRAQAFAAAMEATERLPRR